MRALLLLVLLGLIYFIFDGLYLSPGSGKGKNEAPTAGKREDPGQEERKEVLEGPSEDELGARKAQFDRHISERAFVDARVLASALSASPHEAERRMADAFLEQLGLVGENLVKTCAAAITNKDFARAEGSLRAIKRAFPKLAEIRFAPLLGTGGATSIAEPMTLVSELLRPELPMEIDKARTLQKFGSEELVLRIKGEAGGVRYQRLRLTGLCALEWRKIVIRAAGSEAAADSVIQALASLYERELRPLAAALLRSGLAKVLAGLRDSSRPGGGRPR